MISSTPFSLCTTTGGGPGHPLDALCFYLLCCSLVDCVPGRANTTTLIHTVPGVVYGQCSEICGALHGYMPLCISAWCLPAGPITGPKSRGLRRSRLFRCHYDGMLWCVLSSQGSVCFGGVCCWCRRSGGTAPSMGSKYGRGCLWHPPPGGEAPPLCGLPEGNIAPPSRLFGVSISPPYNNSRARVVGFALFNQL